jgi:hypothetical protein
MARVLVLVLLLGLLFWGIHWFRTTPAPRISRTLRRALIWGGIGLLVVAVASGRLNPLFAALAAGVPAAFAGLLRLLNLLRLLPFVQQALQTLGLKPPGAGQNAGGSHDPGTQSRIRTRYLEMTLNPSTGHMDGRVLDGPFRGERLSALSIDQLARMLELYQETDAQSAAVLRTYLERRAASEEASANREGGEEQSEAHAGSAMAGSGRLTREEASAILGLRPDATADAIRTAHRRLMQKLHPDRGGSDYLAARINAAKKALLGD